MRRICGTAAYLIKEFNQITASMTWGKVFISPDAILRKKLDGAEKA